MLPLAPLKLACTLFVGVWLTGGATAMAQSADSPEPIAVLDVNTVDISATAHEQSSRSDLARLGETATGLLRIEMSKRERYALVSESHMAGALQTKDSGSTMCTERDCATAIGRSLGVKRVFIGTVTKASPLVWFITLRSVDVESGEVQQEGPIELKGDIVDLLPKGIAIVVRRITEVAD